MRTILAGRSLDLFRRYWNGRQMLRLVQKHNRVLVDWPVGIGKSYNQDDTIEAAINGGVYDLVIALMPTRKLIDERRWIQTPPANTKIVNLKPRPKHRCGDLNTQWEKYERNGLGALGRKELCKTCSKNRRCKWPKQLGKALLKGVQVVFSTQTRLDQNPNFIDMIISRVEAKNVLVILDEANFIMKTFKQQLDMNQLRMFNHVLKGVYAQNKTIANEQWLAHTHLLLMAPTKDLRTHEWSLPALSASATLAVQKLGWNRYGDAFKFLGYDILNFCKSSLESREKLSNGDICFAIRPRVSTDFIIYSATAHTEFAQYRVGEECETPFKDFRFEHPQTVWYNIASMLGAKAYFFNNATQILDFFAGLIAPRLSEEKRVVLIAKQCFEGFCAVEIEKRLHGMGLSRVKVVPDCLDETTLQDPDVIPLIHYGISGTNLFKNFDCVYCLTGYYVSEEIVNDILQDIVATDIKIPIEIKTTRGPRRRSAQVKKPEDLIFNTNKLSQLALDYLEMGTVIQAVGRVRPHTFPREIITFQCGVHPKLEYTKEFNNLKQAREFFGIESMRSSQQNTNIKMIKKAKSEGLTQIVTVEKTGLSPRTVKRYWNIIDE